MSIELTSKPTPQELRSFQKFVLNYFKQYGRHQLPWRQTFSPYSVMVSELMLQQTQVERVIPKFNAFMKVFPDVYTLAQAPIADLITQWQGLGYNRRVLLLQRAAQAIVKDFGGVMPSDTASLLSLPGIGPYTAAAIQAFAFNQPATVIETNVRTVYIYHFFHAADNIADDQLVPLIEATMDYGHPRVWFSAIMDYGTYLKSVLPNPTRKSKHYAKQSTFVGSNRQVRGAILKHITAHGPSTLHDISQQTQLEYPRIVAATEQLVKEGFVEYNAETVRLKQ